MQIIYATYQFFPDYRTNTFQTISTIDKLIENKCDVELVYPDRKKTQKNIEEFYDIKNTFKVTKIKHTKKFEFKNQTSFNKFAYIFNHLLFANRVKKYIKNHKNINSILYTRSPYVLFSLGSLQNSVIYEVHQVTKITKLFIRLSIKKNKKIIFVVLTPYIQKLVQSLGVDKSNILYLETGYDESIFAELEKYKNNQKKEIIRFIFGGSLDISGENKGIEQIILGFDYFIKENSLTNIKLDIYCSSQNEKYSLDKFILDNEINDFIKIHSRASLMDFYNELLKSDIGLIPLPDSDHVNKFSSSMKFFEYIRAGLVILCSNVEANKRFNYEKAVFIENDLDSIKKGIQNSLETLEKDIYFDIETIKEYSYENRIDKLINKINQF